jgi:enoyl-CoA hydratase/carnithine racemase
MNDALLRRDEPDGVRWLTFNRPERLNSFTAVDYHDLRVALTDCQVDNDVRVVVLTGTGRSFSVGADRSLLTGNDRTDVTEDAGSEFFALVDTLSALDKPLIAAVNGFAIGFGCTVLLYTDIVLVATTARLRLPFTSLGLVPEAGSSGLLSARMRPADAMWAALTSEWIDSDRAVASGLAWRAVGDEDLQTEARDLAAGISALDPDAVRATKRLMTAGRADITQRATKRELAELANLHARHNGRDS